MKGIKNPKVRDIVDRKSDHFRYVSATWGKNWAEWSRTNELLNRTGLGDKCPPATDLFPHYPDLTDTILKLAHEQGLPDPIVEPDPISRSVLTVVSRNIRYFLLNTNVRYQDGGRFVHYLGEFNLVRDPG